MSLKRLLNLTLTSQVVIFCSIFLCGGGSLPANGDAINYAGQTNESRQVISREDYGRALDIIFSPQNPPDQRTTWEFVLRFEPSFKQESQIVLRRRVDGATGIREWSANGNIWTKLNSLPNRGQYQPAQLKELFNVNRKLMEVSTPEMQEWQEQFFRSLEATARQLKKKSDKTQETLSVDVVLDGTIYEVWYNQGTTVMHMKFYDVEVDTPGSVGQLDLVRWMNGIRTRIGTM